MSKLVKQGNHITEAHYNYTAMEQNVMMRLFYEMKEVGFKGTYFNIELKGFKEMIGGDVKTSELRRAAQALMQKIISFKTATGWISIALISSAEVIDKDGRQTLEIGIDRKIMMYYQDLSQYTIYDLQKALTVSSKFSKRIYQMLSQFRATGLYIKDVDELKDILGLQRPDGSYKYEQWSAFEKYVLKKAQEELAETESIYFDYTPTKRSKKKIIQLRFDIYQDKNKLYKDMPVNEELQITLTSKFQLAEWQALQVLRQVPEQQIRGLLYQILLYRNEIRHMGAYSANQFNVKFKMGWTLKQEKLI